MDNAQKAIMIGVGLFITIIIIAAVMLITGMGQNLLNKGTDKVAGISASLDMTELEAYDNTSVNGSNVVAAVKKYWTDANIVVYVKTGTEAQCTTYTALDSAPSVADKATFATGSGIKDNSSTHNNQTVSMYTSSTGTNAIATSAKYKAYLIKVNNNVVGIYFEKA